MASTETMPAWPSQISGRGSLMSEFSGTIWPSLSTSYTDEFGQIEPNIYQAAGAIWKDGGERFAVSTVADAAAGLRLMLKAAAIVSRKQAEPGNLIKNVPGYLFQTYRHLVIAELEKEYEHRQCEVEAGRQSVSISLGADVDRSILILQIMQRMDDWMRDVFKLLALGHTFEEIGRFRHQNAHALRTKFNKHLKRLTKQIQSSR